MSEVWPDWTAIEDPGEQIEPIGLIYRSVGERDQVLATLIPRRVRRRVPIEIHRNNRCCAIIRTRKSGSITSVGHHSEAKTARGGGSSQEQIERSVTFKSVMNSVAHALRDSARHEHCDLKIVADMNLLAPAERRSSGEMRTYVEHLNLLARRHRALTICLYDVCKLDGASLVKVIAQHPYLYICGQLTVNTSYGRPLRSSREHPAF